MSGMCSMRTGFVADTPLSIGICLSLASLGKDCDLPLARCKPLHNGSAPGQQFCAFGTKPARLRHRVEEVFWPCVEPFGPCRLQLLESFRLSDRLRPLSLVGIR